MQYRSIKKVSKLMLFVFLLLGSQVSNALPPKVVVTIKPIHSLVAGVMEGISAPDLLLPDFASPHTYALRPSDAKMLSEADLVIWVGPLLETFLEKPLKTLSLNANKTTLIDLPAVKRYPFRAHETFEEREGHHTHEGTDPHIWLMPQNAKVIVSNVSEILQKLDKENASIYAHNADVMLKKLDALNKRLAVILSDLQDVPFVVFHDAYQYFEKAFALKGMGAVRQNPDLPFGAKALVEMQNKIKENHIQCLFTEPEFENVNLSVFEEANSMRLQTLDPLGAYQKPGKAAYFDLMEALAKSFQACLLKSD